MPREEPRGSEIIVVAQDRDVPRSIALFTQSFRCPAALRHRIGKLLAGKAQFPDFEENVMHAPSSCTMIRALQVVTVASIEPRRDEMSLCVHG